MDNSYFCIKEIVNGVIYCEDSHGNKFSFSEKVIDGCRKGDVYQQEENYYKKLFSGETESACLFVTNKCNSNCYMCPDSEYARKKDLKIEKEDLLNYVMVLPSDLPYLDITGGEPTLLGMDLPYILKEIFSHFEDVHVMILSNGRAFADTNYTAAFSLFQSKEILFEIPIHGFNIKTHDLITQAKGSFDQTMCGIKNLIACEISVGIRIVVSKLNIKFIHKIVQMIGNEFKQIRTINIMGLEMLGNAFLHRESVWIEFEEISKYLQKIIELCFLYGIEPRLYNFPLCMFEEKYWTVYRKSISPHKIVYLDECADCPYRMSMCGGFFASTARLTTFKKG